MPTVNTMEERPFIIWTLRRTGGTNLADALFDKSRFCGIQHEPFNCDRLHGRVVEEWDRSDEKAGSLPALDEVLAQKVLIKHCVEVVPAGFNQLLAARSIWAGYRHVLLYRRRPLERLQSLHFANVTGVWGKIQAETTELKSSMFSTPVPVESMVSHELHCRNELLAVYKTLLSCGASPLVLEFEDLYFGGQAESRAKLLATFRALGLDADEQTDLALIDNVLNRGEQGTRQHYNKFSEVSRLQSALADIGEFCVG